MCPDAALSQSWKRGKGLGVTKFTRMQEVWRGPKWEVAAGFGMLKGGRADWLVEKATELGAHAVRPLVSERVRGAGGQWLVSKLPGSVHEGLLHAQQLNKQLMASGFELPPS